MVVSHPLDWQQSGPIPRGWSRNIQVRTFADASQEALMNNAKLQCDGRDSQGFRTPESSGFGEEGSQEFSTFTLRAW